MSLSEHGNGENSGVDERPPAASLNPIGHPSLQVCRNCKRLKRKCDRKQPKCTRCHHNGLDCQYGQIKGRPGPAKGSVKSKTEFLCDKIRDLEETIRTLVEGRVHAPPPPSLPDLTQGSPLVDNEEVLAPFDPEPPSSRLEDTSAGIWDYTHDYDETQATVADPEPSSSFIDNTSCDVWDYTQFHDETQVALAVTQNGHELPLFSLDTSESCHPREAENPTLSAMSRYEKETLLGLYFEHIHFNFPMFQKNSFYADFVARRVPSTLLLSMFSLSSRFLTTSRHTDSRFAMQPDDYFRAAYKDFRQEMDANEQVSMAHVKTACLLALYDYSTSPSRRAWLLIRESMSLALAARLHEVDSPESLLRFSEAEKEERRFLWWTVWKLDCTVNVASVTPFGIELRMINTALVSTTVQDFTSGTFGPIAPVIPEMDPVKSWTSVLAPNLHDTGDGFNTHLYAVSLLRASSDSKKRLNMKPCPKAIARKERLHQILASLHLVFPEWRFSPTKHTMENEYSHRLRLETIIMLNSARLILHEPPCRLARSVNSDSVSLTGSISSWKENVVVAKGIALIFDSWQLSYSAFADPIISCALWHAYCALKLYCMSGLEESSVSIDSTAHMALERLRISLEGFTPWWPIARVLRDSLQAVPSRATVSVDVSKLVGMISHSRKAFDPYRRDSEKVDATFLLNYVT